MSWYVIQVGDVVQVVQAASKADAAKQGNVVAGPYTSKSDVPSQYLQEVASSHASSGVPGLDTAAHDITDLATATEAIGGFTLDLEDPDFWISLGWLAIGVTLSAVGIFWLFQRRVATPVGERVVQPVIQAVVPESEAAGAAKAQTKAKTAVAAVRS